MRRLIGLLLCLVIGTAHAAGPKDFELERANLAALLAEAAQKLGRGFPKAVKQGEAEALKATQARLESVLSQLASQPYRSTSRVVALRSRVEGWLEETSEVGSMEALENFVTKLESQIRVPAIAGEDARRYCGSTPGDIPFGPKGPRWSARRDVVGYPTFHVICVDVADTPKFGPGPLRQWRNPLDMQHLYVVVRRTTNQVVEVEVEGASGIPTQTVRWLSDDEGQVAATRRQESGGSGTGHHHQFDVWAFGPFLPGEITVRVHVGSPTSDGDGSLAHTLLHTSAEFDKLLTAIGDVERTLASVPEERRDEWGISGHEAQVRDRRGEIDKAWIDARASIEVQLRAGGARDPGAAASLLGLVKQALRDACEAFSSESFEEMKVAVSKTSDKADVDALIEFSVNEFDGILALLRGFRVAAGAVPAPSTAARKLIVERTVIGLVRLGAGVAFGGAASGRYDLEPLGDGRSKVVGNSSPAEFELVLGYTQLLNRRPIGANAFRTGPTAALGLASVNLDAEAKFTALRSLYFGWEFGWDQFAIAPSVSLRMVDRLSNAYRVGEAVSGVDQSDLTVPKFGVGFGLLMYAPQLVRVGGKKE